MYRKLHVSIPSIGHFAIDAYKAVCRIFFLGGGQNVFWGLGGKMFKMFLKGVREQDKSS